MTTAAQVAFSNGDMVKVRTGNPPTHYRTPVYVQGRPGAWWPSVASTPTRNPWPTAATERPTSPSTASSSPDRPVDDYNGPLTDRLQVDIYEQWLERVA